MATIEQLEEQLNDFNLGKRKAALERLNDRSGDVTILTPQNIVNMHMHSFHSYNPDGSSPLSLLWRAKKEGLNAVQIVEFDVLNHLEETLLAGDLLGMPFSVGLETRVFVPELANEEINSPGEPGIAYQMGSGFYELPTGANNDFLSMLAQKARDRNIGVMERVNKHLGSEAAIDYERDVIKLLTPSGNATERHMVSAYAAKAAKYFQADQAGLVDYWMEKLNIGKMDDIVETMSDTAKFHKEIRAKLMKRGGVGYVQPDSGSFPNIKEFFDWVSACGGKPTATWLDGMSDGEKDPIKLLDIYCSYGAQALNIVPFRGYKPEKAAQLYENMGSLVHEARKRGMLIIIGTELNAPGLPFVNNWASKNNTPYRRVAGDDGSTLCKYVAEKRAG